MLIDIMQYSFPSGQGSSLTYYSVTTSLKTLVNWHKLGVMLKISKPTLNTIQIDYAHLSTSRQRDELVDVWLHSDTQASWIKLCQALEEMGESVLAERIKSQYCPTHDVP